MKPASLVRHAIITAALACAASLSLAAYPDQPIRLVVPFPAAGSTDLVTRVIATDLGQALGQSIIVENRAGAGSLIGSEFVARAMPDGYTLLMAGLTNVFLPYVHKEMRFNPVDDFVGIGLMSDGDQTRSEGAADYGPFILIR